MVKKFNKRFFVFSLIYLSLTLITAKILGFFFYNARPFVVNNFTPLIQHAANNGFPSDHSLISFAFVFLVFTFNRKSGFILFALALMVGISRVYAGVHFPIDILGSFVISVVAGLICVRIFPWKK